MKPTSIFTVCTVIWLLLLVSVQAGSTLESLDRNERAAIGDRDDLWTNGTVYYSFDSSVCPILQRLLVEAMTEWQNETCLQFQPQDQETDYIKFYSYPNEEHCTCDSVGKMGGEQEIKIGYSCESKGELLHIVGHVIGLWNEQARPDRDSYVQILEENIVDGQECQFEKRNTFTIDYQGTGYDYGSIMHLGAFAYSKNGYETTKTLHGDYEIGQREELSENDIRKVNTLYHCPSERVKPGKLQVTIVNVTVYSLINANPRIEVTAVDSNGDETIMYTAEREFGRDDAQTQESELIEFPVKEPKDWQFFRIRILGEAELAFSKTVHIIPGQYRQSKYCINENCDEYLEYAYKYIEDGNECRRNPCNHGTCTDLFVDYMCTCPTSYYGKDCEHNRCETNPCQNGGACELDSTNSRGYTCQCTISYYGEECQYSRCYPNPCQNSGTCQLASGAPRGYTCSCSSYYHGDNCELFNHCYPNPCQNNGWCSNTNPGYSCHCRVGFTGTNCEHKIGYLSVYIRTGHNLPDEDPWPAGNSDPYVKVVAYDISGYSVTRYTEEKGGDHNPTWNKWLSFGLWEYRIWTKFTVRVYDDDGFLLGDDDPMSDEGTYFLHSHTTGTSARLDCYRGGHIEFDYKFVPNFWG